MALQIPVLTPDQVGALPAPRAVYGTGENVKIEESGKQAIAQAEGEAGQGLDRLSTAAALAKQSFDQSEVMARINDLGEYKNKKVDNEALKTSGREVIGVTDRALADYDTSAKALLDTLANRQQQKMFAQHVAQDRVVIQRQLLLHEHDQLDRQGEIDFRSGLDRYASDAGLRWNVPEAPDVALSQGIRDLAERAKTKGWSDEQLLNEQRNFRARVVASVVNNATARPEQMGSGFASAYLNRYSTLAVDAQGNPVLDSTKGLIDADVVKQLSTTVRAASLRDVVRKEVDRIQVAVPPDRASGIPDITKQIELARSSVKNSDALPEVESQLHSLWNLKNADRAKNDDAAATSMILGLDEQAIRDPYAPPLLNKADPRWQQMTDAGREKVTAHIISLQHTQRAERDLAFQAARADFYSHPIADRARVNPVTAYPSLDKTGRDQIQHLVLASQDQLAKDNGVTQEGVRSSAFDAAKAMGYSKQRTGELTASVEERLAKEFPNRERPPQKKDVDRIIGDELLTVKYGSFLGIDLTSTKWEADKAGRTTQTPLPAEDQRYVPNQGRKDIGGTNLAPRAAGQPSAPVTLTPQQRQRVVNVLAKTRPGYTPTEQDILDTWNAAQRGRK